MTSGALSNPFDAPKGCNFVEGIIPYAYALAARKNSERNDDIIQKRLNLGGSNGYTVQAIGDEYRITRERVR